MSVAVRIVKRTPETALRGEESALRRKAEELREQAAKYSREAQVLMDQAAAADREADQYSEAIVKLTDVTGVRGGYQAPPGGEKPSVPTTGSGVKMPPAKDD